jgi:hypothetical protein
MTQMSKNSDPAWICLPDHPFLPDLSLDNSLIEVYWRLQDVIELKWKLTFEAFRQVD